MKLYDLSWHAYMRTDLGLTQQQLADTLGISRSALAMAEIGLRPMPVVTLPILRQMTSIARRMPYPQCRSALRTRQGKSPLRSNNRVVPSAQLPVMIKKPFVTAQTANSASYNLPPMTKYSSTGLQTSFSTHLLQLNEDCKKLLGILSIKRDRMRCQLDYLQLETTIAVNRRQELAAELQYVNVMIQSNLDIIAKYPFVLTKRKLEHRNAKLFCKKLVLEDRLAHFNAIAMILRQHHINIIQQHLQILDQLITTTGERMVELDQVNNSPIKSYVSFEEVPLKDSSRRNDTLTKMSQGQLTAGRLCA